MKQQKKFNPGLEQELAAKQDLTQNSVREFSTVEELLRHDAARTSPPAGLAERLRKSSADFPKPARSWWQRLFGQ